MNRIDPTPTAPPTDGVLLAQMEADYANVYRQSIGVPGFAFLEQDGLSRVRSDLPSPWFNLVLSTRLGPAAQRDAVRRIADEHGAHGLPLLWRLGPATLHREDLRETLIEQGFVPAPPSAAIIGPIPRLVHVLRVLPLGPTCRPVTDLEAYRRWFDVFGETFGIPDALFPSFAASVQATGLDGDTRHLMLEQDGEVVAVCTAVWRERAPFASLFNFAVSPRHRRRHLGKVLLAHAALDLHRRGCRAIGQFATPEGVPFYLNVTPARQLGVFENWVKLPGGAR